MLNFENTYGTTPSVKPSWPVDALKSRRNIVTPGAEPPVPEKISSLHKSQMEDHPEVRTNMQIESKCTAFQNQVQFRTNCTKF